MSMPNPQPDNLIGGNLINNGVIVIRPPAAEPPNGGRTFIVTGLHRSGTTLLATILRQVGIFMGAEINDIVHEDETIAQHLTAGDNAALTALIAERNATYGTWGFKFPSLHRSLAPADIGRFSNPQLIVTFRDPVSVAVRAALSEYQTPMQALRAAIDEQAALTAFIDSLSCPTLLLSYEKSLIFPARFIDAILAFCGLPRGETLRDSLLHLIEPNRPTYIAQARRVYDGVIDGLTDGALHGWCRLTAEDTPVTLELLADDLVVTRFVADQFRPDLRDAGFGTGHHAFAMDLGDFGLRPDAVIRVRVAGYGIELKRGGRMLAAYGEG